MLTEQLVRRGTLHPKLHDGSMGKLQASPFSYWNSGDVLQNIVRGAFPPVETQLGISANSKVAIDSALFLVFMEISLNSDKEFILRTITSCHLC